MKLKIFLCKESMPYWDDGCQVVAATDKDEAEKISGIIRTEAMEVPGAFADGEPRILLSAVE